MVAVVGKRGSPVVRDAAPTDLPVCPDGNHSRDRAGTWPVDAVPEELLLATRRRGPWGALHRGVPAALLDVFAHHISRERRSFAGDGARPVDRLRVQFRFAGAR